MKFQFLLRKMISVAALPAVPLCLSSQPFVEVEGLGLADKLITSVDIYGSIIVVGTNGEGVYYQNVNNLPDSGWIYLGLEGKNEWGHILIIKYFGLDFLHPAS